MARATGHRSRRRGAAVAAVVFSAALAAVVASQLALISVLDAARADQAAGEVAASRFAGDLVEQTVRRSVGPLLDAETTERLAVAAGSDPTVRSVIRSSLITAHRQVVEPRSVAVPGTDGNAAVTSALGTSIADVAQLTGVDLGRVTGSLEDPAVVPDDLPELGLRRTAERVRLVAGVLAVVAATVVLVVHPRRGRALSGLGWKAALVCGVWAAGLLAISWVIDTISETLFGELLASIWSTAVPTMLAVLGAGLLLSGGVWLGGVALDGLADAERPPGGPSRPSGSQPPRRRTTTVA